MGYDLLLPEFSATTCVTHQKMVLGWICRWYASLPHARDWSISILVLSPNIAAQLVEGWNKERLLEARQNRRCLDGGDQSDVPERNQ